MNEIKVTKPLFVFLLLLPLLGSCSKDENHAPQQKGPKIEFTDYEKDDLSVSYPSNWTFQFDDSPSLYADRTVQFKVSELSLASIYVFDSPNVPVSKLLDEFIKDIGLYENEHFSDIQETDLNIDNIPGIKISYVDTFVVGSTQAEISVFQIQKSPKSVFATLDLNDDQITNKESYQSHFLKSIRYQ